MSPAHTLRRTTYLLVGLAFLAGAHGCADEPAARATPSPTGPTVSSSTGIPRLDLADEGSTVALTVGGTASVTLVDKKLQFGEPQVDGDAVTISEMISDAPSAGRSWLVTAQNDGDAVVSITGSPICRSATPPCMSPDLLWAVRFVVS